jgi:hypothetical protein
VIFERSLVAAYNAKVLVCCSERSVNIIIERLFGSAYCKNPSGTQIAVKLPTPECRIEDCPLLLKFDP